MLKTIKTIVSWQLCSDLENHLLSRQWPKTTNREDKKKQQNNKYRSNQSSAREIKERSITLSPSTERRPLRIHSLRPVPRTITSYSSSMVHSSYQIQMIPKKVEELLMQKSERERDRELKEKIMRQRGRKNRFSIECAIYSVRPGASLARERD